MLTSVSPTPAALDDSPAGILAGRFLDCLRLGDGPGADAVIDEALALGVSPEAVHALVITPAMIRVGELWERNVMTVADEHVASSLCQRALVRLFEAMSLHGALSPTRERVLLAAVQGQLHAIGLRMVADVLERAGFDVVYLGEDVPVETLSRAIAVHRPAVVGLGCGMPVGTEHLAQALAAIHELMPEPRIMLGGRAIPPALRTTPYPRVSSTLEVVEVVERLLAAPPAPRVPPQEVEQMRPAEARFVRQSWAPGYEEGLAARLARLADDGLEIAREHIRRAAEFRDLALRDPLTGLLNRRGFDDHMSKWTQQPAARGALLMIDIDDFKGINDRHGHAAGDRILRGIGHAISACIRSHDVGARLGGDEFAVLLPGLDVKRAVGVADRIRAGIAAVDGEVRAGVSIGVATLDDDAGEMLKAADAALYAAKADGRDRVVAAAARTSEAA